MKNIEEIQNRKIEHIKYALKAYSEDDYFKDIKIFNNSIPEINYDSISLETIFLKKKISMPIMINAMTGGTDFSFKLNDDLSVIAKKFNIPIAVGSQSIMLKDSSLKDSFKIMRKNNKEGVILSNLSAMSSLEEAKRAVDILEADGIQLHMNVAQELVMAEGDRNFKGMIKNIENIVNKIEVPVILKEVGSGISYDTSRKLRDIGVKYIDVGGKGGTSFIKIESLRNKDSIYEEIEEIEISTPHSIINCKEGSRDITIIASGGINKGSHIVKSLILGSSICGIAGPILSYYLSSGKEGVEKYLNSLKKNTKILMGTLGCESLKDLKNVKYFYKEEREIKEFIKTYRKL